MLANEYEMNQRSLVNTGEISPEIAINTVKEMGF